MLSRRRFASRPRRARTSASPRAAPFSTSAFLIAQIAMRMAILRGSSRRRIASLRSSASCSLRDIGPGVGARGLAAQGVLRALPALCGGLLLAPDARRFVVLATARLGEDAGLLDQLIEPSQRLFEALVRAYPDLCQTDPSRRACPAGRLQLAFACHCMGRPRRLSSEMRNERAPVRRCGSRQRRRQSAEGSTLGCISSITLPQHSMPPSPALMHSTSVPQVSHWNRFPSWLDTCYLRLTSAASAGRSS